MDAEEFLTLLEDLLTTYVDLDYQDLTIGELLPVITFFIERSTFSGDEE